MTASWGSYRHWVSDTSQKRDMVRLLPTDGPLLSLLSPARSGSVLFTELRGFRGAGLRGAGLRGAGLRGAGLCGAGLRGASQVPDIKQLYVELVLAVYGDLDRPHNENLFLSLCRQVRPPPRQCHPANATPPLPPRCRHHSATNAVLPLRHCCHYR